MKIIMSTSGTAIHLSTCMYLMTVCTDQIMFEI